MPVRGIVAGCQPESTATCLLPQQPAAFSFSRRAWVLARRRWRTRGKVKPDLVDYRSHKYFCTEGLRALAAAGVGPRAVRLTVAVRVLQRRTN